MLFGYYLLIGTCPLDATVGQLHYFRAVFQGCEAMGDNKDGHFVSKAFDRLHDSLLGFVVEGASGFVKDNNVGLLVEGTCDTYALALPSGEADAAFANIGLVLFWPAFDDVGNLCLACGLLDLLVVDFSFWDAKSYVFFDSAIGKEDGLGNVSDMCLPCPVVGGG